MGAATSMTTADLAFHLPEDLIAQHPAPERGESRLLVLDADASDVRELGRFDELLLDQLDPSDLVIANDARVLNARITLQRPSGGAGEVLLLAPASVDAATVASTDTSTAHTSRWSAMARPARKYRDGMRVETASGDAAVTFIERTGQQTWEVELPVALTDVPAWLARHGELPLPPYITGEGNDPARYQTVHARRDGAVAAPTAGLHFDDALWERVRERCDVGMVTLHVGAGTFLPVADGPLSEHDMHGERYEIASETDQLIRAALRDGRRIVAVGTTSARVLEHVYRAGVSIDAPPAELSGSTRLFIVPGHEWSCVGALLTNFHLPKSTLIALVMSFAGIDTTRAAYEHAIAQRMRFYSFGDAMFVHGRPLASRT